MAEKPKSDDIRSLNIYQKLAEITGKIGIVAKGGTNTEQKYAFIEYAAVAGKLRALFAEYGVLIVPRMPKSSEHIREEITTKYGSKGVAILIDFTFEIVNADKPDDKFEVTWTGEAADYGDKGTNKAATSALKYYLMRQFNISEKGEDNDEHTIDRGSVETPPAKPKISYVTKKTIEEITAALMDKGVEADDVTETLLKLAKVEDVMKITAATGQALLDKVKKAESSALRSFVYGGEEPTDPDADDGPSEPSGDSADVAEEPEVKQVVVNEKLKKELLDHIESFDLKPQYKIRFIKEATGHVTPSQIKKDSEWLKLNDSVMAVLNGDVVLPDEQIASHDAATDKPEDEAADDSAEQETLV